MNKSNLFPPVNIISLLVLLLVLGNAKADDTEIFFNIERDVAAPNILFVLDNSGSMRESVDVLSVDFDPSESYTGNYETDDVYYYDKGWLGFGGKYYRISSSAIECEDIQDKLDTLGKTSPYLMAHNQGRKDWSSLDRDTIRNGSRVVCKADNVVDISWWKIDEHVFKSGNYLNWYENHREATRMSRLDIVKQVSKSLADGLEGVNIGLMAFDKYGENYGEGGVILEAVRPIAEGREDFKAGVLSLKPETNTPLSETLFGAKRYFEGKRPFLSSSRWQASNAMNGDNYKSPIELQCQANYVVFLTDGEPTYDDNHKNYMANELGIDRCSSNCLDEISEYMFNNDISDDYEGVQRVITHTVGFHTDQELLSDTAKKGGGKYYLASSPDELEGAFFAILREVLSTNTTFSSPGVSVNNFNQLNHLDALYFSVFEPVVDPRWPGNLKRYRLRADGVIVDKNGDEAIDPVTGFFKDKAQSYWSAGIDGANVSSGGVSSVIPSDNASRNVYTYYKGSSSRSLKASVNNITTSNSSNLTKSMFGDSEMSDARHKKLIRWTRGQDVADENKNGSTTDSRRTLSDPLHSRPYLQVYGGTEDSPDTTVYYGDNQGFLHAVDGETGELHFSFIPGELLGNQGVLMDNEISEYERPYGMDGSIVSWFKDINGNGSVDTGDSVYIYSGMRRGGRNYYGLDVTDRNSPSVLWVIRGGEGDFQELGQSWSDPVKHRVRLGKDVKDVLFISGGYDSNQDATGARAEDSVGRAIYMIDAKTGERLWWSGPAESEANLELSDLKYSIPATPTVIDVDGDGLADQLYVGDMGGQILRMDFKQGQDAEGFATGGVIADFGGSDASSNRRFYHSPDISGTLKGGKRYLNLAIGSGYQAHPLNSSTNDRFYKLTISAVDVPRDDSGEVEYTALTESDLLDTTDNLIQEGSESEKEAAEASLAQANGWYIRLTRSGEKVLSASTTLRGDLYFTTFEPSANLDACVPAAGQSRLYHIKLRDGRAVVNYDKLGDDDNLTESDRYVALKTLGLPPSPKTVTIDGEEVIVAGTETLLPPDPGALVRKIYWYEE